MSEARVAAQTMPSTDLPAWRGMDEPQRWCTHVPSGLTAAQSRTWRSCHGSRS
nr:MAG TPA: hypothetical protein [Caudoviricetes sp.]